MKKNLLFFGMLVIITVWFVSCVTTSAGIKSNPQAYSGRKVRLSGEITVLVKVPLTAISVYVFEDKEGKVAVLSGAVHEKGERFILKGTVSAFPEKDLQGSSGKMIKTIEKFLVEKDIVSRDKAEKAASAVGKALDQLLKKLGSAFIITEDL